MPPSDAETTTQAPARSGRFSRGAAHASGVEAVRAARADVAAQRARAVENARVARGRFGAATAELVPTRRLRAVAGPPPLVVADVALFYAEYGGGIRSYIDAKRAWVRETGAYEHHLITPGARERHDGTRHELTGLSWRGANGYRAPLGTHALRRTLREIRPDVVLLHDPFWGPRGTTRVAQALGARVLAVQHGSAQLDARALPGPAGAWAPLLRAWSHAALTEVDGIMSVTDARHDTGRVTTERLRLGLNAAFVPQPTVTRGQHVLYVGRLAKQKGVFRLLEAASLAREPYRLQMIGSGPSADAIRQRAHRLGIADRVEIAPFVSDPRVLAREYAAASVVVMPGEHETFGLVALEAAACGARVVCCETAPSGERCGALAHRYEARDAVGLARAIRAARATPQDLEAAGELARRHAWSRLLAEEHDALESLVVR